MIRKAVEFWSDTLFLAIAGSGLVTSSGAKDRSLGHRLSVAIGLFLVACLAHGMGDAGLGFVWFSVIGLLIGTIAIMLGVALLGAAL